MIIKSKRTRQARHIVHMGDRNTYEVLVGQPEGNSHFEEPDVDGRSNTEMHLRERGWNGAGWIHLA
jgi:hypothetical protein